MLGPAPAVTATLASLWSPLALENCSSVSLQPPSSRGGSGQLERDNHRCLAAAWLTANCSEKLLALSPRGETRSSGVLSLVGVTASHHTVMTPLSSPLSVGTSEHFTRLGPGGTTTSRRAAQARCRQEPDVTTALDQSQRSTDPARTNGGGRRHRDRDQCFKSGALCVLIDGLPTDPGSKLVSPRCSPGQPRPAPVERRW